ncbi:MULTISPECIES: hypothetical protein [Streptomyces]|uniref:Secreted protein n=1 Tax=Streptomyces heilongjiangensis TaxID=945052 RepID=A0ABW1B5Z5_9ACTN|nr:MULTISPECIES: hypothetical protein [Streptomyces]MDC2947120.1 hypothetical protein [Streptomyces heilongjiangensis]
MSRGARSAIRRPLALALAVLTLAGLLAVAGPAGSAEAASSCAGRKVRTLTFDAGTVRVYRKGGRYVCAVLVPRKQVTGKGGAKARKGTIRVRAWAGQWVRNKRHPAGPVTVHAGRRPVCVHARVGSVRYTSGWILR